MMAAIGYLRTSTKKQNLGLEVQRSAIEQFAAIQGYEIAGWYSEQETGKGFDALDRRPQLAAALSKAKRLRCPVLVHKLDRLSRDVAFVSGLMAQRVPFIVTELGADKDPFLLHIYAAVAEQERRFIARRTRDALQKKKEKGDVLGNLANLAESHKRGAATNARSADHFAANVLPIMREIEASGRTTLAAIAEALNGRKVTTARGGEWHASTVRNLLARRASSCVSEPCRTA
jgi:DNA invertase Pin-like site-specific DNA recombinase